VDFLQFINHIQKKITGKNRVHGIMQGHNKTFGNVTSTGVKIVSFNAATTASDNSVDITTQLDASGKDVFTKNTTKYYKRVFDYTYPVFVTVDDNEFAADEHFIGLPLPKIRLKSEGTPNKVTKITLYDDLGSSANKYISRIKIFKGSIAFKYQNENCNIVIDKITKITVKKINENDFSKILFTKDYPQDEQSAASYELYIPVNQIDYFHKYEIDLEGEFTASGSTYLGYYLETPSLEEVNAQLEINTTLSARFFHQVFGILDYKDSNSKTGAVLKLIHKNVNTTTPGLLAISNLSSYAYSADNLKIYLEEVKPSTPGKNIDEHGTASSGFFNADMVDGLHVRTDNLTENPTYIPVADGNLNPGLNADTLRGSTAKNHTGPSASDAYIPIANGFENHNLAAARLKETYSVEGASVLHQLLMDSSDSGLYRKLNETLVWRINSYNQSSEPWLDTSKSESIEAATHSALFFGNALGVRGTKTPTQSGEKGTGAMYFGAQNGGGFGVWGFPSFSNNSNWRNIITNDGTIEGSSIADNSVPLSKLQGNLPASSAIKSVRQNWGLLDYENNGTASDHNDSKDIKVTIITLAMDNDPSEWFIATQDAVIVGAFLVAQGGGTNSLARQDTFYIGKFNNDGYRFKVDYSLLPSIPSGIMTNFYLTVFYY
jgi:hypothetical protein